MQLIRDYGNGRAAHCVPTSCTKRSLQQAHVTMCPGGLLHRLSILTTLRWRFISVALVLDFHRQAVSLRFCPVVLGLSSPLWQKPKPARSLDYLHGYYTANTQRLSIFCPNFFNRGRFNARHITSRNAKHFGNFFLRVWQIAIKPKAQRQNLCFALVKTGFYCPV